MTRRAMLDGPYFSFTYLWSGLYPTNYTLDLSGSGCSQSISWERVATTHILDRGDMKRYHKGWKLKVQLVWGHESLVLRTSDDDIIPGATEAILGYMYNATCNEQNFYYPYPELHPSTYFDVVVVGDFNMQYVTGLDGTGYRGTISLVGKTVFNEIPTIGTLGILTP